ncbi:hypothetical protein Tco_1311638 [Tanacetum coccineum]
MATKASISSMSSSGAKLSTLLVKGVLSKTGASEFQMLEFSFSTSLSFSLKRGFLLLELKDDEFIDEESPQDYHSLYRRRTGGSASE